MINDLPPTPSKGVGDETPKPAYITANPLSYGTIKEFRDVLKENPTKAEALLWQYLRSKKTGHKIRRQHIIDNYIADFVCLQKRLIIEVDGLIHETQQLEDRCRTFNLNKCKFKVIRFTNEELFRNPQDVANQIKVILDSQPDFIIANQIDHELE